MEKNKKHLTVKTAGHSPLNAFPNTEGRKKNPNAPHYKGDGIAIWINETKEKKTEEKKETEIEDLE